MRAALRGWVWAVVLAVVALPAAARDGAYVQVEAQPTLEQARAAAARYATSFEAVVGYVLGTGWYAIALGPYPDRPAAEAARRTLFAARSIPPDAFVVDAPRIGPLFWPEAGAPPPAAPAGDRTAAEAEAPLPEETLAEARRSEATLDRDARAEIQTALQWFGHYDMTIDAAFGPGIRRAMAAWQEARGVDATGVLTTRQRAALREAWMAELAAFGFDSWRDEAAGIEISLPLGMVAFDRHAPPFAVFTPRDACGVELRLISQAGTPATLSGLYEILQTLEVVPLEGARARSRDAFTLTGQDSDRRAHIHARYRDGQVKGFMLLWPAGGDDAAMARVTETLQDSLRLFGPTLPDAPLLADPEALDHGALLAGLEPRRPLRNGSGFFVDAAGRVATAASLDAGCRRFTIDSRHGARVVLRDRALGLMVLEPEEPLSPLAVASFAPDTPELRAEVVLAGFALEDLLTHPLLTFGRLAAPEGLGGEPQLRRLSLEAEPGDIGGPVFDRSGAVVGMLLPPPTAEGRLLPGELRQALGAEEIVARLRAEGLRPTSAPPGAALDDVALTRQAAEMTVPVSCWN